MKSYSGRNFTDFREWQVSNKLVNEVFRISTAFSEPAKVVLVPRLQNIALKITNVISEGLLLEDIVDRKEALVNSKRYLVQLKNLLIISRDQKYLSESLFDYLWQNAEQVHDIIDELLAKV